MQLYTIDEIPRAYGKETVFRQSVLGKFLFFATCLLLSVALIWFARAGGYDSDDVHLPPTLLYWIGAVLGFLALLGYFYFRASLKQSNWLKVRSSIDRSGYQVPFAPERSLPRMTTRSSEMAWSKVHVVPVGAARMMILDRSDAKRVLPLPSVKLSHEVRPLRIR